jgi:hypothetical protein
MSKEYIQPTDEQIRVRAYCLWETDGKPQGRDWEYWLKAKEQLANESESNVSNGVSRKTSSSGSAPTESKKRSRTPAYA